MKRLWAPWRMEYIEGVDEQPDGCFLCNARDNSEPRDSYVLWQNDQCITVMNRWPYNNGHLLVAPLRHVGDLDELSQKELMAEMQMIKRCKQNIDEVMAPDGFNIGLNLGRLAGAGLEDHLHWHIVPRWSGDTNFMPVTAETKVIPQSLGDLWNLLKEADKTEN